MLVSDKYIAPTFIEREIHLSVPQEGERSKKSKASPLQIAKQNHWDKVKACRRTIQLNYKPGDLWVTFGYKGGTRKEMHTFCKDMEKLQDLIRDEYAKQGYEFKWIRRLEIGRRGGLHAHFLINDIPGALQILQRCWKKASKDAGRVHVEPIDDDNGYEGLAEYICKDPSEEIQGQMVFLLPEERKRLCKISSSRNLKRPVRIREKVNPWAIHKILTGRDVLLATRGYYIEPQSVRMGISSVTHTPYIRYRERKIEDEKPGILQKVKNLFRRKK